jgi:hypothetical protein
MADRNRLIAMCGALPVLWLDESLMEWQVLDQHISQVQDALAPSILRHSAERSRR